MNQNPHSASRSADYKVVKNCCKGEKEVGELNELSKRIYLLYIYIVCNLQAALFFYEVREVFH